MSVNLGVFLVDWEDFNSKIARVGESAVLEGLKPDRPSDPRGEQVS
jgi:hypothetical protein